ncbi:MAG: hypothetical protein LBC65_06020 [Oscillospiraceae bacterium]|jgi:hypothetical protein|nr:hypothetical protein [Oscillospiraceae bacterium]
MFKFLGSRKGAATVCVVLAVIFGYAGIRRSVNQVYLDSAGERYRAANNLLTVASRYPHVSAEEDELRVQYRIVSRLDSDVGLEYRPLLQSLDSEFYDTCDALERELLTVTDRTSLETYKRDYQAAKKLVDPLVERFLVKLLVV